MKNRELHIFYLLVIFYFLECGFETPLLVDEFKENRFKYFDQNIGTTVDLQRLYVKVKRPCIHYTTIDISEICDFWIV